MNIGHKVKKNLLLKKSIYFVILQTETFYNMKTRKYFILLFAIYLLFGSVYAQENQNIQTRKKVAVVLSGGGAKGSAHIGALKVLEKAGIPIDIICGTSMGALIGGLYSIGYDANTLDSLIRSQDWNILLSDKTDIQNQNLLLRSMDNTYFLHFALNDLKKPTLGKQGIIKGTNLSNLFTKLTSDYQDSLDFNSLPIPFSCVAVDLLKYNEIDFHSGVLADAMRASMSIPGVFEPVKLDTLVLLDGGLRNNFPTDIAVEMGADIIIGINVQNLKEQNANEITSTVGVINQLIDANTENKTKGNIELCDVFVHVNIDGYSAASFSKQAIDTLIQRGETATLEHWEELMKIKEKIGLDENYSNKQIPKPTMLNSESEIVLNNVHFDNINRNDKKFLKQKYNLKQGNKVSISQIERATDDLGGLLFYSFPSYKLNAKNGLYDLEVKSIGKKRTQVSLGVRFDNEEKVSMQFQALMPIDYKIPILISAIGRLGTRSMGSITANLNYSPQHIFFINYTFHHNDINIYSHGSRDYNVDFNHHKAKIGTTFFLKNILQGEISADWDYYNYRDALLNIRGRRLKYVSTNALISYHTKLLYYTKDNKYFATKGSDFEAEYVLSTDNFYEFKNKRPISALSFHWQKTISLNNKMVLEPMIYSRSLFGDKIPFILYNCVGGHFFSHYLEQQMPFAGIGNIESVGSIFAGLEINSRYRLTKNTYTALAITFAQTSNEIKNLFSESPLMGIRGSYFYNSFIGPIGTSLSYSNRTHEIYLYVNIGYEF